MSIFARAMASLNKPLFGGTGGAAWVSEVPRSEFDYALAAGRPEDNSAVFACLKKQSDAFSEAVIVVQRRNSAGRFETVPGHPGELLLRYPNPKIPRSLMWEATLNELADRGNDYWYKIRSASGRVLQLWPAEEGKCRPMWFDGDGKFISYYELEIGGTVFALPPEDVIHFRDGLDRRNHRLGVGRLRAVRKETATDNEATGYAAAMLRNTGIPGVIISRKNGGAGSAPISPTERKTLVEMYMEKFRGERRGEPLIANDAIDVTVPGFSPRDMTLDTAHQNPEARIAAALDVPAMVAGLGVGDKQRTYSNFKEAREAFYEGNIITKYRLLGEQLDMFLLPDIGDPATERFWFDTTEVRALQPDMDALHNRVRANFKADLITRFAALKQIKETCDETRDNVFYSEVAARDKTADISGDDDPESESVTGFNKPQNDKTNVDKTEDK